MTDHHAGPPAVTGIDLSDLNAQQTEAVTHPPATPLLVLACAGSGKTRVLVRRIAWLISTGTAPHRLMAVTFTNKAAAEMRHRLTALVGPESAGQVVLGTFHSLAARILRAHPEHTARSDRFSIWSDAEVMGCLRRLMRTHAAAHMGHIHTVREAISYNKNHLTGISEYTAWAPDNALTSITATVWEAYEAELAASDALDFDDLLAMAVGLLEGNPGLLDAYRHRYRHILVDEFQDTNAAQMRFLRVLAGDHKMGLTCVGDDDQSIYAFRGADPGCIEELEERYPDTRVVLFTHNYRSTPQIIQGANNVLAGLERRHPKRLEATNASGPPVTTHWCASPDLEADWIARQIRLLIEAGTAPGDICVLARTRSVRAPIEHALTNHAVKYTVLGGHGFYDRAAIRDALAYLTLVANPNDREAFTRMIQSPARGIGPATIAQVLEHADTHPGHLLEVAPDTPGLTHARRATLTAVRDAYRQLPDAGPLPDLLHRLITLPDGLIAHLRASTQPDAGQDIELLRDLYRSLENYEQHATTPRLVDWLAQVSLDSGDDPDAQDQVTALSTVHAAKGLEWPIVFIAGMETGVFPSHMAETPLEQAEERRLAYVAVTRAQRRLVATGAATRMRRDRNPSPYLAEITRAA